MKSGYFIGKWSFQLFFQSWLLCSSLFAQTNLDSIAQLIESTEGKEKAANYALLSWEYRFTDKEKALDAGDAGLAYSRKINDTSGIAGNLNSIAETHLNFGDMELAEKITLDELLDANPSLLAEGAKLTIPVRTITKPIPIDDKKVSTRTHVVKSGDSLGSIAQKYAVSVDDIVALNPQITDRNMIFLGQVIVIP